MTIDYIQLSATDYSVRRFDVISLVECKGGRPDLFPYRDTKGYPTIGIGFKIKDNWRKILEGMGFDMSEEAPTAEKDYIAQIEAIINQYGAMVTPVQFTRYKKDLDSIMANRAAAYGRKREKKGDVVDHVELLFSPTADSLYHFRNS